MADPARLLAQVPKFGDGIGLVRCRQYLENQDLWVEIEKMKRIAVTGSSGKGAVVRMIAAALYQRSVRTGRFISPHFLAWPERVAVDDDWIAPDALCDLLSQTIETCHQFAASHKELGGFGRFEILFLAAMEWFARTGCSAVVVEAGIGGRYDPIRSILPQTLVLTSLDLEHTELLGSTLEEIAYDKLDAAPEDGIVVRPDFDAPYDARISGYLSFRGVEERIVYPAVDDENPRSPWYSLNQSLAAAALVSTLHSISCSDAQGAVDEAMRDRPLPGDFAAHLRRGRRIIVDGAHTSAALAALARFAEHRPGICIVGISEGRSPDALAAAARVLSRGERVFAVQPQQRGMPSDELTRVLRERSPGLDVIPSTVAAALAHADGVSEDVPVYVFGSLFLASEVTAELRGAMWEPSGF